jgi:hypothetical protein
MESVAAGGLVERLGGLLEELRTLGENQIDERLAEHQAGLDVLITVRWNRSFLERRNLRTKLERLPRCGVALSQQARAIGPAAA